MNQDLVVRYRGIARIFGPFMDGAVRTKLASDLERLAKGVEGELGALESP